MANTDDILAKYGVKRSVPVAAAKPQTGTVGGADNILAKYGVRRSGSNAASPVEPERESVLTGFYRLLPDNTDWAEKSKAAGSKIVKQPWWKVGADHGDDLYDFINDIDGYRTTKAALSRNSNIDAEYGDYTKYTNLLEDEVKAYNYLYATQGRENAENFLSSLDAQLSQREAQKGKEILERRAEENPVVMSALSVPANLIGGAISAVDLVGQNIRRQDTGKAVDYNSQAQQAGAAAEIIRSKISGDLEENTKATVGRTNVASFLYNTLMSGADSLAAGLMAPTAGAAGAMLATGAGTSAARNIANRGGSDDQALIGGVAAGAFEALFERFSIGNFKAMKDVPVTGLKDLVKNTVKSMGVNASEEMATEMANILFDTVAMGDVSNWEASVRYYMEQEGMTEEQAKSRTVADLFGQVLEAGASGALMGAGFAGVGALTARQNAQAAESPLSQPAADSSPSRGEPSAQGTSESAAQEVKQQAGQDVTTLTETPAEQRVTAAQEGTDDFAREVARQMQSEERAAENAAENVQTIGGLLNEPAENTRGDAPKQSADAVRTGLSDRNGQRTDGARAGGEDGVLAEGADRARERAAEQQRAAGDRQRLANDLRLNPVSSKELGLNSGTDARVTRVLPAEHWDDSMRQTAQRVQQETGKAVTYVVGAIQVRDKSGNTHRVRGVFSDAGIILQADNLRYTIDQIADHETYHDRAARNPELNQRIRERIAQEYTKEELAQVLEGYVKGLRGLVDIPVNASTAQKQAAMMAVLEEVYADAYAGMNAFGSHAERFNPTVERVMAEQGVGRSRETARATERTTGPPERFSYAGRNAREADTEALNQAHRLEMQGVDAETIRRETGWFRGADRQWRWEIDDSGMEYHRRGDLGMRERRPEYARYRDLLDKANREALELSDEKMTDSERAELKRLSGIWSGTYNRPGRITEDALPSERLADYLKHDSLFENYPHLRNTKLVFAKLKEGTRGRYSPGNDQITLDESLRKAPEKTLIHEIQHAIQEYEGFSGGSNYAYWEKKLENNETIQSKGFLEAREKLIQFQIDPANEAAMELRDRLEQAGELDDNLQTYDRLWAEAEERGLDGKINEFYDLQFDYHTQMNRPGNSVPSELYRNTAGEIEARDAGNRWYMGAKTRQMMRPDTGNGDTVFADRGTVDYAAEKDSIKDQLRGHQQELEHMEPVATIQAPEGVRSWNMNQTRRWVEEKLRPTGYQVDRNGFGVIVFDEKRLNTSLDYLQPGGAEVAAYAALPRVLKRGVEISSHENHKGREYGTVTIAAPVILNGKRGNMAVVVKRTSKNFYKMHRILAPDGTLFVLSDEMNNAELTSGGGVTENGSLATPISSASESSLRSKKQNVNVEISDAPEGLSLPRPAAEVTEKFSAEDDADQTEAQPKEKPKKKTKPKMTKPPQKSLPMIAKQDLKQNLLNLFSIPEGQRTELGAVIDYYAEQMLKEGSLTQKVRDAFFDRMYASGVVTVKADPYYQAGRSAVAGGRVYVNDQIKGDFGEDWKDFRKRAFAAGVYLTNDKTHVGVDVWNQELAEILPGMFDREELDGRTVLERIVQAAEEGKDEKMSLADYTAQLAQQERVTVDQQLDGIERQMDWALRTFAEKAKLEVKLRDRTGIKMAQMRAERKEAAERQRADRELKELQQKTLKQLQWLSKNRNRAPADVKAAWDEVLGDIDLFAVGAANEMNWSEKYNATWRDLAQMYKDAQKNDPNFLPSKELERIVARLDDKKIGDMDIDALQSLYRAAIGLRQEFYNRNNVLNDQEHRLFQDVFNASKDELEGQTGKFSGKAWDKLFNLEQLTPLNVMQRMAGWNPRSAWFSMAKQIEKGERDVRGYTVEANRYLEQFLTEHEDWVKKADGQGKDAIWYELEVPELVELQMGDKPIFGDTFKVHMTPAQKVHMYLESKSEDNLRHMVGGRTFVDKELYSKGNRQEAMAQGRTIKLAPETVKKIVSDLTAEERELARLLENYYNDFAKDRINRVSNVLYGYDKAISKNYAPIYTNRNYTKSEIGIFDATAEGVGNLKARQYSKNPSYNLSCFDAFERHVDQTARFVGMAIPARNWQTLLNWRVKDNSMADILTHKWGEESKKYITSLLEDLQGGKVLERDTISSNADKIFSKYIAAVFGANPSIVLKQLGSIPLASAYLDVKNIPSVAQLQSIDRELIRKYTQELDYRTMGYSMPETKILKENPGKLQSNKFLNFTFGGGAITAMDGWAASTLWPWAENKVHRDFPELAVGTREQIAAGQSPFYQKVAELFNEAVVRTQSVSDEVHQSVLRKSRNPITRAFTMFKSDAAQGYNVLRQKIGEAQYYKKTGASEEIVRKAQRDVGGAFLSILAGYSYAQVITFLIALWKNQGKKYKDDDGELTAGSVLQEMVSGVISDVAGMVVFGQELAEVIGNIFTGETWYGIDTPGNEQLNDLLETVIDSFKGVGEFVSDMTDVVVQGGSPVEYLRRHGNDYVGGIKDAAAAIATYGPGLPVNNLEAYLLGLVRWVIPEAATAYDDLIATATKSGLSGLTGDALNLRVRHVLENRAGEVKTETVQALAELYEAGYTKAVPTDTQNTLTVGKEDDKEELMLDAYQQQLFDMAWRDAISGKLDELADSELFREAEAKKQETMVNRLYDYAREKGRAAVSDRYEISGAAQKADKVFASGASVDEWLELYESGGVDGYLKQADYEVGVTPEQYVRLRENIEEINDNSSVSQAEAEEAIRQMEGLTMVQKAALWQLQNKGWSAKNNPFSTKVGQSIKDALDAESNTEEKNDAPEWVSLPKPGA